MVTVMDDETDCEDIARQLLNGDYNCPTEFNTSSVQRKLSTQPWASDLIFNYLCNAMTVDNPTGEAVSPSIEETSLALSILSNFLDIAAGDIAKHYTTRV